MNSPAKNLYSYCQQAIAKKQVPQNLYGLHVVTAALQVNRREFYNLYISKDKPNISVMKNSGISQVIDYARKRRVPVKFVDELTLDKKTDFRPHQGIVLEASSFPIRNIKTLSNVSVDDKYRYKVLFHEGKSDKNLSASKSPVWLALENIEDPQNLGSIIRSAYFMGIDGIICTFDCANVSSSVTSKASAASVEVFERIFHAPFLTNVLSEAKDNGWRLVGTALGESTPIHQFTTSKEPIILVMGNEGKGISSGITALCDDNVNIPSCAPTNEINVDSLNVSVATGILIQNILSKRSP